MTGLALTMLGAEDALACEGDACLVPGALLPSTAELASNDAGHSAAAGRASGAAAESNRAVTAALDEGASL